MKTNPFALCFFLFALATGLGSWFLVLPQLQSLQTARAQLAAWSPSGSLHVQAQSNASQVAAARLATRQQVLTLVPASDGQYDLAVEIEGLSKACGTSLTALALTTDSSATPAGTTATTGAAATSGTAGAAASALKQVQITVGVSGAYAQVQRFVTGLPTLDRFVTINQVAFSGAVASDGTGANPAAAKLPADTVAANVTAAAYFLPRATPVGAATPAAN